MVTKNRDSSFLLAKLAINLSHKEGGLVVLTVVGEGGQGKIIKKDNIIYTYYFLRYFSYLTYLNEKKSR